MDDREHRATAAVGPYTSTAEAVIGACAGAGTHYADLSGELPLLRRVIDRFDDPAPEAACQVVQLAGWEHLLRTSRRCTLAAWRLGRIRAPGVPPLRGPSVSSTSPSASRRSRA